MIKLPLSATAPTWALDSWGVPILDLNLQPKAPKLPVTLYGSQARAAKVRGTLAFYVDDHKFSALMANPMPVVMSEPDSVIEVNYSTLPESARAEVLYFIWCKRWLSRFWQDWDIPIFVDLNVLPEFFNLALLGVPLGWASYANRAKTHDLEHLFQAYDLARDHAGSGIEKILYVVYGGGVVVRDICVDRGWVWLPEQSDLVRGRHGQG